MNVARSNTGLLLPLLVALYGAVACAQARGISTDKVADFVELEGVVKTIEVPFREIFAID